MTAATKTDDGTFLNIRARTEPIMYQRKFVKKRNHSLR